MDKLQTILLALMMTTVALAGCTGEAGTDGSQGEQGIQGE